MERKTILKYEDSLKKLIIAMLENGELTSLEQARKRFQISGNSTITRWLKRAGKQELIPIQARRTLDLELTRTCEYDHDLHDKMLRTLDLEKKKAKIAI
jgi:hypothetical protein